MACHVNPQPPEKAIADFRRWIDHHHKTVRWPVMCRVHGIRTKNRTAEIVAAPQRIVCVANPSNIVGVRENLTD